MWLTRSSPQRDRDACRLTKIYGPFGNSETHPLDPLANIHTVFAGISVDITRPCFVDSSPATYSPLTNGVCSVLLPDVPRMEKSPLLANGYNHPPTHLSHMQFMQLGGHPGAGHTAILSPASLPHHLQAQAQARAEQGLKVNPNMSNMEALAR